MNTSDLNSQWLDFYALLGAAPDADKETLRRTIGTTYAEASANCDHRDLSRRHYFQTMVERVLPQARRVLLDPKLRQAYDEQNALHQKGDPNALNYVSFMAAQQNGGVKTSALPTNAAATSAGEFDSLPEKVRDEIDLARAVLECVQSGSEFEFLPAKALSGSAPAPIAEAIPPASLDERAFVAEETEEDIESMSEEPSPTSADSMARLRRRMAASTPDNTYFIQPAAEPTQRGLNGHHSNGSAHDVAVPDVTAHTAALMVPRERAPREPLPRQEAPGHQSHEDGFGEEVSPGREIRAKVITVPPVAAAGPTIAERRAAAAAAAIADPAVERIGRVKAPTPKAYKPRVVIGDEEETAVVAPTSRRAVLSPLATHLLTGILSALLIFTIIHFSNRSVAAPIARLPLTVMYSSDLRPVMEKSEADFEASEEGAGVDVVLQPMDARAAMRFVLDAGKTAPDVWIPSEAMWSTRYNEVAASRKRHPISMMTPLALSPLVLVARSDHASALRQQFPTRKIDNWDTLRTLVATNCAQHFGMTDPKQAGSGALARFVMARQWCARNRVPWNAAAASNTRLWEWIKGFEANVPQYKSSGDMVKDLALGTTGQYWWSLAYESDAIYWISQGKQVEVFYLPATYYADHPFCHIDRPGTSRALGVARARFEKFLRSSSIQTVLLQSGFRPPEIDLSAQSDGNPFQSKGYAARGVRANGFEAGGRLDYRTVNGLTAQWAQRYSS